jgi:hypothetical protein
VCPVTPCFKGFTLEVEAEAWLNPCTCLTPFCQDRQDWPFFCSLRLFFAMGKTKKWKHTAATKDKPVVASTLKMPTIVSPDKIRVPLANRKRNCSSVQAQRQGHRHALDIYVQKALSQAHLDRQHEAHAPRTRRG